MILSGSTLEFGYVLRQGGGEVNERVVAIAFRCGLFRHLFSLSFVGVHRKKDLSSWFLVMEVFDVCNVVAVL